MATFMQGSQFSTALTLKSPRPLDSRGSANTIEEVLTEYPTSCRYLGMKVFVETENKYYVFSKHQLPDGTMSTGLTDDDFQPLEANGSIEIDGVLSNVSKNPVENRVIYAHMDSLQKKLVVGENMDETPTEGSQSPISSDGVAKAISGLRKLEHLRKLIILCDSQYVKFFWDLVKDINYDRTNVIFKLNWFRDEDVPIINEDSNRATVGIFTNGLGKFHDVFLMKNVALLYYTDYYLQISHYMSTDVHFQHLINDYFPWKMEIQGNNLQAHVGERGILKMKGLTCLTELFVNEARYDEKIKIEFPKSLQYLNINNVNSFDKHGLIGLEETMVPKDIIGQYSSNI